MSTKKPEPIFHSPQPNLCPVCGRASYSAAGIHPQCAVKQADDKHQVKLRQTKTNLTSAKPNTPKPTSRWQKICPKCNLPQHVRKKECDCGHTFARAADKPGAS